MRDALRVCTLMALVLLNAVSAAAQAKEPPESAHSARHLPRGRWVQGKGAAHSANEQAWSAAFTKGRPRCSGSGMTDDQGDRTRRGSSRGANGSAAFQKNEDAMEANATLTAEGDERSEKDGELLNRTSTIVRALPAQSELQVEGRDSPDALHAGRCRAHPGAAGAWCGVQRGLAVHRGLTREGQDERALGGLHGGERNGDRHLPVLLSTQVARPTRWRRGDARRRRVLGTPSASRAVRSRTRWSRTVWPRSRLCSSPSALA